MRIAVVFMPLLALAVPQTTSQTSLLSPAPSSPLHVGRGSGTILLGDVNGDGRTDLLTRHLLTRLITVQFGDGRGGFTRSPTSPIELPYEPGDMALGDLNSDGRPDLAITPGQEDIVDVLLGGERADFRRTTGSPFTVTTSREPFNKRTLRLADINEDGHLDVVTANGRRRNSFEVMYGDGRGGLSRGPSVKLDSGCDGYVFALGDLSDDQHLDVVSACHPMDAPDRAARLTVQLGDGAGRFIPIPEARVEIPAGARSLVLADMNGDRHSDIVVMQAGGLATTLLNGEGTFSVRGPAVHMGRDSHALRVTDLNRDGKPDLIAAAVDCVIVFVATEAGYAPIHGSPFSAGPGAYNVVVGDVNADGRPDVAASSFEGDAITLLLGRR